ncbi:MAG: ABC transporter permease subunit [Chloroflexota bacterium]|nr:ABC transporter permease subunit [Chloroflexota bacterium]
MVFASAAMTIAVPLGLVLGIIASGQIVENNSPSKYYIIIITRLLLGAMRSIHELVWAVLFVAAVGLSPLAAIISLAIPYAGILGRIYSELIQDVPNEPIETLRSAGASPVKLLMYGYIPLALTDLLSYTFYRFECAIRASAILSFIGIQGIGYQIQLSLHDLLFDQVWTLLIFLIVLIVLVDLWSTNLRRKLME